MDIKKLNPTEALQPNVGINRPQAPTGGPSFKETLEKTGLAPLPGNVRTAPATAPAPAMNAAASAATGVKFSNHAIERMQSRGIKFSPEDMKRLGDAVGRAASKGSKDSLILMNDAALIVSVKNNTVVTVMDKTALKENVFTNIDSTIVM